MRSPTTLAPRGSRRSSHGNDTAPADGSAGRAGSKLNSPTRPPGDGDHVPPGFTAVASGGHDRGVARHLAQVGAPFVGPEDDDRPQAQDHSKERRDQRASDPSARRSKPVQHGMFLSECLLPFRGIRPCPSRDCPHGSDYAINQRSCQPPQGQPGGSPLPMRDKGHRHARLRRL